MSTFILRWNPEISSFKQADFKEAVREAAETQNYRLNWSIREYEKARPGDRFYLLRVGHGKTGIVMSGNIASNPYRGEDWSGKGRTTFYADLIPDFLVDTERCPRLSIADLEKSIPNFTWGSGHSGVLLDDAYALTLEWLWLDYLLGLSFSQRKGSLACNALPSTKDVVENFYHYYPTTPLLLHFMRQNSRCEICGYDYGDIFQLDGRLQNISRYFPDQKGDSPIESRFHCICSNCTNVYKELRQDSDKPELLPFEALIRILKFPRTFPSKKERRFS